MGKLDHQNVWVHYKELNVVIKTAVLQASKILIFQKLRQIEVLCESLK